MGTGTLLAALLLAVAAASALAASPSPNTAAGDPRSAGEGPGLVGDPLTAIIVVLVIGVTTVLLTLAWTRFRGGSGSA